MQIHLFDPLKNQFWPGQFVPTQDCSKITNVVVGRASTRMRLFVTCEQEKTGNTILKFFDKLKGVEFVEVASFLTILHGSQPFIVDLNGDFL